MSEKSMPVDGPFRIYVESIPTGVTLDVEAFVERVVYGVVEALQSEEYADRFAELEDLAPVDPHAVQRPGDLAVESLVADLVAVVGTKVPVYGWQVLTLANQLLMRVPMRSVPSQRAEGGAAA
ncbi:hypothetical protein [Streptomyces sp. C1-2]|uniref:hypothetical protein n=1 Tax=Streptomyces sp. C1-2 TaxID=2720022 RepID=UPI0014325317|nr:hypothetical protein [Streptomyces sp. C1-2]NJP71936.1 hypothetical protein [Streptomyces sp. C1-2]